MNRQNNPLNIRHSRRNRWLGQSGSYKGFCVFTGETYGYRAAIVLLSNYIRNGVDTPRKIINRFAPAVDGNDVDAYLKFVCDGLLPDEPIDRFSYKFFYLIMKMAFMESHSVVSIKELRAIAEHFNLIKYDYISR